MDQDRPGDADGSRCNVLLPSLDLRDAITDTRARTGACCTVRTVLNYQALPIDFTYGGIPNWCWRLFEVQLGIIAACIPALSPGYQWSQSKMRAYISSHTKSSNTYTAKQKPAVRQIEQERTAHHLRAHPANVYGDPPMMLRSGDTKSCKDGGLGMTGKAYVQDSITIDVESQQVMGSLKGLDQEAEESRAWQRPSLEVDLRPRFSLDGVDSSLERIGPAPSSTTDHAGRPLES